MNIEQINSAQKRLDDQKEILKHNFRQLFNFEYKCDDDLADKVLDLIIDCVVTQTEINQTKYYLMTQKEIANNIKNEKL